MQELERIPFYVRNEHDGILEGIIEQHELFSFQKYIEQQLNEAQHMIEWLKLSFDTAYEGITIVDEHGVIQMFNETYSRFVGVTKRKQLVSSLKM